MVTLHHGDGWHETVEERVPETKEGLPLIRPDATERALANEVVPCQPTLDTLGDGFASWRLCDDHGNWMATLAYIRGGNCE